MLFTIFTCFKELDHHFCVDQQLRLSSKTLIFHHFCIKILLKLVKKANFDQLFECTAPKSWSHYISCVGLEFLVFPLFISRQRFSLVDILCIPFSILLSSLHNVIFHSFGLFFCYLRQSFLFMSS